MKGTARKGFMHIVEIVIIFMALFFVIFQFLNIPAINTEWSETKLLMTGNDLLYSLEGMGVDWMDAVEIDALLDNAIKHGGTRNTTIIYDVELSGVVKPSIRVGCICLQHTNPSLDELGPVKDALQPFYLNGKNISFTVEQFSPMNPTFFQTNDVIIIGPDFFKGTNHPAYTLDDYKTQITSFLRDDKGMLVIRNYTESAASAGTLDQDYFGVNWSSGLSQSGSLLFSNDTSLPDSSYYDVFKYFYGFPNSSGLKIEPPYTFTNLLTSTDRTTTPLLSTAECGLEVDNSNGGVCALILNRGPVNGQGRTAWLSRFEDSAGVDDGNDMLLKSVVSWLAGDTNKIIENEDMKKPAVSKLYKMPQPPGLVASWGMGEGSGLMTHDSSGNANHGSITGAEWTNGRVGNALHFDGTSDYANMPDDDSLDFGTGQFTILFWTNFTEDENSMRWISKRDGDIGYEIVPRDSNRVSVMIGDSTAAVHNTIGTADLNDGDWHHVSVVWDNPTVSVYVDGAFDNSDSTYNAVTGPISNGEDLTIGGRATSDFFNGTIDNVMLFNRALDPYVIKGLYDFPDQFMFQPVEIKLTLGYIY